MARDMSNEHDFGIVQLPANAGKSREPDYAQASSNDIHAQHQAAAQLAYSLHGSKCTTCGSATSESALCRVGLQLYSNMRALGVVG